ncbi:MATE efflux family protein [Lophiostoma macrostomum CBS 122681]|uniref:MATE efflux family protein n=1 Tax=Lophiostoma macrostomum CBS 122681 TaxID=1314788 RepID=A0A6A6THA8_9PLEO|nr:MATE efflux family protein [Lophiostoma macrostomum CBS 122681]
MESVDGPRRFSITTPLLKPNDIANKSDQYGTVADPSELEAVLGQGETIITTTASQEAKLLLKYSVPLTITYLLQYSFSLVTIFVVGHIGTDELGAVSLATMTANITGYAVFEGLATSLDTLCAQAYGSGRKEQVGLHLQRMILLMLLVTIPIGAVWLCSGWILAALVPERELAMLAGSYLRILLASTPGYAIFEASKRFTQAQGLFNASLFVLVISTPLNIVFNYVFVFVLRWDLTGAALATVLSNSLLPVLLWVYVYFVCPRSLECWGGFTRAAFQNWSPMIHLAIPGIIMVEAEWLAFDILTFSSSYLSTAHLAAQSVVMTTCVVMFHIPFSVSVAVSTRLGNLIGAASLEAARIATRTYVLVFAVIGLVDAALIAGLHSVLPKAFSDDGVVVRIASGVMPVLAVFQLFDASTALVNSVLRGLGKQVVGGYVNLFVYYVVAVPLALFMCFGKPRLELRGLWIGCVVGSGGITLFEGLYCWLADWRKAVENAEGRERED